MISRPIVCGTVFGYLLGDIKSGLWIGMIAELIWGKRNSMGAAIPNDSTSITLLAIVWGIKAADNHSALILALAIAAPIGIYLNTPMYGCAT